MCLMLEEVQDVGEWETSMSCCGLHYVLLRFDDAGEITGYYLVRETAMVCVCSYIGAFSAHG